MRNSRTPAGFKPKGWPIRLHTWCPDFTFKTAKNKAKPWSGCLWDGSFRLGWIGLQGLGKQNHGVLATDANLSLKVDAPRFPSASPSSKAGLLMIQNPDLHLETPGFLEAN